MKLRFWILFLLAVLALPAYAVQPNEMLADAKLEARARAISAELRCLVCQNQSIDDSDADLAHDLRVLVRQRLQAGDSDAQVKQYLVARYGDYVLLDPPMRASTIILWAGAPFFVLAGCGAVFLFYRRRRMQDMEKPLTEEERQRLEKITNASRDEGMRL